MLEQVVAEGQLADHLVRDRQPLYKGMNGRYVERIYLVTGETLLFKPLTNNGQHGREAWIYEHVLSWLPGHLSPDDRSFQCGCPSRGELADDGGLGSAGS